MTCRFSKILLVFIALNLTGGPQMAFAQAGNSGQPLPRFVSLRADQVNLRAGPGVRYPIDWVYMRRNLPVEVIAEFDNWRKVRDWEGSVGWVHSSMLTSKRTFIVLDKVRVLRRTDEDGARPIARMEPGIVGRLLRCPEGSTFCQVEVDNRRGWLKRGTFWGVNKNVYF